MEGISHEAISLAGHLKLGQPDRAVRRQRHLHRRPDQPVGVRRPDRALQGLRLEHGDGSTVTIPKRSRCAIANARAADRQAVADRLPDRHRLSARRTRQGTAATHGSPLGEDEIKGAREKLGWPHAPSRCPKPILAAWRAAGARSAAAHERWNRCGEAPRRREARASHRSDRWRGARQDRSAVKALKSDFTPRGRQARHPPVVADGAGEARARRSRADRRLGRSHRLERHHTKQHSRSSRRRLRRQLHPLRRARARHGGGHERHGAAWRPHSLRRHLPRVHRLLPRRRSACRR